MIKEVKRFYIMPGSVQVLLSGDPAYTPMTNHLTDVHTVPLVLASDYDALLAERDRLQAALRDMLTGWRYIRETHGDLYGVGWDRAEDKARAALQGEQK